MSIDFNDIANNLLLSIGSDKFDSDNEHHVHSLKKVLSEHIKDEEMLFRTMLAFLFPDSENY